MMTRFPFRGRPGKGSNIVRARQYLILAVKTKSRKDMVSLIQRALRRMYRAKRVRRAPAVKQVIDWRTRREVRYLARHYPKMTIHQIANRVGLRSGGRVSEILHNKR